MKLNRVYADNEYRSHCGSCYESSEEEIVIALVPLSKTAITDLAREYIIRNLGKWNPMEFVRVLGQDFIYWTQNGSTYCPNFGGEYAGDEEIDITHWKVEEILTPEDYARHKAAQEELHRLKVIADEAKKKEASAKYEADKAEKEKRKLRELQAKYPDVKL